jgi:hypothetical protein
MMLSHEYGGAGIGAVMSFFILGERLGRDCDAWPSKKAQHSGWVKFLIGNKGSTHN